MALVIQRQSSGVYKAYNSFRDNPVCGRSIGTFGRRCVSKLKLKAPRGGNGIWNSIFWDSQRNVESSQGDESCVKPTRVSLHFSLRPRYSTQLPPFCRHQVSLILGGTRVMENNFEGKKSSFIFRIPHLLLQVESRIPRLNRPTSKLELVCADYCVKEQNEVPYPENVRQQQAVHSTFPTQLSSLPMRLIALMSVVGKTIEIDSWS